MGAKGASSSRAREKVKISPKAIAPTHKRAKQRQKY